MDQGARGPEVALDDRRADRLETLPTFSSLSNRLCGEWRRQKVASRKHYFEMASGRASVILTMRSLERVKQHKSTSALGHKTHKGIRQDDSSGHWTRIGQFFVFFLTRFVELFREHSTPSSSGNQQERLYLGIGRFAHACLMELGLLHMQLPTTARTYMKPSRDG